MLPSPFYSPCLVPEQMESEPTVLLSAGPSQNPTGQRESKIEVLNSWT